jgi:hypothetical protein
MFHPFGDVPYRDFGYSEFRYQFKPVVLIYFHNKLERNVAETPEHFPITLH